ncbi:hypothetical protein THRCLA_03360 [Thraustotheca clavata]|uniref:Uncharacterized protein n=1 Tax=Thraustotheca clavata TaxID=74557 RepID=A0A1W0A297_9STRA|nr:hypothetical protein THRCLA_03360 [Thraustotheca clavata]
MTAEDEYSSPMPLKSDLYNDANLDEEDIESNPDDFATHSQRFRVFRRQIPTQRRLMFRRRQENDKDYTFWNFMLVLSFLSLAVLIAIAWILAKSDFFVEHQVDLLGTYVDEHFTVVSNERASVYLQNTGRNPGQATISFADGVLRAGHYKANVESEASFYGLEVFNNGTVRHSHSVNGKCSSADSSNIALAPSIQASNLHAENVIFPDGTTMTTAADVSGGLEQVGDLNFASQKGAIITSTRGTQRIRVNADGTVDFPDPEATPPQDPNKMGIVIEGSRKLITFAGQMEVYYDITTAGIRSKVPLSLESDNIVLGRETSNVTQLTCRSASHNIQFEILGQSSSAEGGNVVIAGGSGTTGGSVSVRGGSGLNEDYGNVLINADTSAPAVTVIGNNNLNGRVELHGPVEINAEETNMPIKVGGALSIAGESYTVASTTISLGDGSTTTDTAVSGQSLSLMSKKSTVIASKETIAIGADAIAFRTSGGVVFGVSSLAINSTKSVDLVSETIAVSANVIINEAASTKSVQINGNVAIGAHSEFDKSATLSTVAIGNSKLLLGDGKSTNQISLASLKSITASVNGSVLSISPGEDSTVNLNAKAGLSIGSPEDAKLALLSKTIDVRGSQINIGFSDSEVHLEGNIFVNGKQLGSTRRLEQSNDKPSLLWRSTSSGMGVNMHTWQEFRLTFTSYMDHSMEQPAPYRDTSFVLTYPNPPQTPFTQISLNILGIRAQTQSTQIESDSVLLRCRVMQSNSNAGTTILAEASVDVELCPKDDDECVMDGIFPSLSTTSFQPYMASMQHYVTCTARFKRPQALVVAPVYLRYDRSELIFMP